MEMQLNMNNIIHVFLVDDNDLKSKSKLVTTGKN